MSRKATITQKEIVNAAFKITRKEGFEAITSRKLAAAAGCSTQPIFRIYENMDALKNDVYEKAAAYYEEYYAEYNSFHQSGNGLYRLCAEIPSSLYASLYLTGRRQQKEHV